MNQDYDTPPNDVPDPVEAEPTPDELTMDVDLGVSAQDPAMASSAVQPTLVFCVACGYNLTGVAIGSTCPECGRTVAASFHGQLLPTSGKAIASLVLGIVSIVGCIMYGIPSLICGPLAIIFSRLARRQINQGEAGGASASMATAGMICGIIGLVMVLAFAALIVAIIVFGN